jgi:hypothetical protein
MYAEAGPVETTLSLGSYLSSSRCQVLGRRGASLARQGQSSTALTRVPPTIRLLACPSVSPFPDWA